MGKPKAEKKDKRKKKQQRVKKNKNDFSWDDSQDINGQLRRLGLCTKEITGDGNCLFRSLSDQYYGKDSQHKAIRQEVCQFLEENKEEYMYFVEDDVPFDQHVANMKQNGTYGGNMELAAFAKLKGVDIKVYQPGLIYIISGTDSQDEEEEKQILHVAYHSWEHYSSIRNINGPATGPPEINVHNKGEEEEEEGTKKEEDNDDDKGNPEDKEGDSKGKVLSSLFPSLSRGRIKRLLIIHKGDVDKIINLLYEEEAKKAEQAEQAEQEEAKKTEDAKIKEEETEITGEEKTKETEKEEKMNTVEPIEELIKDSIKEPVEKSIEEHIEGPIEDSVQPVIESTEPVSESSPLEESTNHTVTDTGGDSDDQVVSKKETRFTGNENDDTVVTKEDNELNKDKNIKDIKKEQHNIKKAKIPVKLSARQRKLETKKRQKELQRKKKIEKEERKAERVRKKVSDDEDDSTKATQSLASKMKELHI